MHDQFDRSGKWLLQHHGDSILRLAGIDNIRSWRALQPEVVHPKQLPDGLLEAHLADAVDADLFLAEIATYPEERLLKQVYRGTMLVCLERERLPEVITVILRPRGQFAVLNQVELVSPRQWTRVSVGWRVVELWKLPAEQALALPDVGLVPWATLMDFKGPPEQLLQTCRRRIDDLAPPEEHANLLAVSQILGRLRFDRQLLSATFGGEQPMIESPLIGELMAGRTQRDIIRVLNKRFPSVPADVVAAIQTIQDAQKLDELLDEAVVCADLAVFAELLRR